MSIYLLRMMANALHLVVKQRRSSLEAEANQANKAEKDEVDSEVKMVHL